MDAIKRNIFWLVLAVVLLVVVGFYIIKVRPVWAEAEQIKAEVDGYSKNLQPYVKNPRKVPSVDKVRAIKRYKANLDAKLEEVKARQYRDGALRFSFQARTLKLDEQAQILEASRNVKGRLEAGMWSGRNQ